MNDVENKPAEGAEGTAPATPAQGGETPAAPAPEAPAGDTPAA